MRNLLEAAEMTVAQGVITKIRDNTFYGLLILRNAQKAVAVDCRPSDAIALCLRTTSPILVSEELLNQSAVSKEKLDSIPSPSSIDITPRKMEQEKKDRKGY